MIVAFIVSLFALCRPVTVNAFSRGLHRFRDVILGQDSKKEFRPPSSPPELTKIDLFSMISRRLGDLEDKVYSLQTKPMQMPSKTQDLPTAAICRVDALEAELINMKKGLHEAQIKQEELLAYIDTRKAAMFKNRGESFAGHRKRKDKPLQTNCFRINCAC